MLLFVLFCGGGILLSKVLTEVIFPLILGGVCCLFNFLFVKDVNVILLFKIGGGGAVIIEDEGGGTAI